MSRKSGEECVFLCWDVCVCMSALRVVCVCVCVFSSLYQEREGNVVCLCFGMYMCMCVYVCVGVFVCGGGWICVWCQKGDHSVCLCAQLCKSVSNCIALKY